MLKDAPLGKQSTYITHYQPDLLFPIPRKLKRDEINISTTLPFKGFDIWTAFELSWLNQKGKPIVAMGEFIFPCESPNIIESKSFKRYLNSFNNTKFASTQEVMNTLQIDLSRESGAEVVVKIIPLNDFSDIKIQTFSGVCIDDLDVDCSEYHVNAGLLKLESEKEIISEKIFSDLLKSNCLVTGQPDWASVQIEYTGKKISHESLLKYIVSFRDHNEFHEQCVERMFVDIMKHCAPQKLSVYARYTRRGGLDINPFRSTETVVALANDRLSRQ
jgi:7-cyano-7-deazaguanine reductase